MLAEYERSRTDVEGMTPSEYFSYLLKIPLIVTETGSEYVEVQSS